MEGDLTGVILVDIQAKTTSEYLRVYILRKKHSLSNRVEQINKMKVRMYSNQSYALEG